MIGQLFVYIYLVPLGPSDEYLQFPTARTMNFDASDFLPQISFRIFEGKWMLLEIWMIIQFQVTAGAKCNKNRSGKNEDEKSYYSVRCNSKHVFFLIVSQILKSSSNVWIPSDKNSFPLKEMIAVFSHFFLALSQCFKMAKNGQKCLIWKISFSNIWIFPPRIIGTKVNYLRNKQTADNAIENVNKQIIIR